MFLKCVKGLIAAVGMLTLVNCSSSSTGGGNVDNLVTQTYSEVLQQAAQAAGDADQALTAKPKPNANFVQRATTFGGDWDTNLVVNNPVTNSGMIPIKDYMGIQLDDSAVNNNDSSVNVFGRLKTALSIFCAIGVMTGMSGIDVDSNGYPANDTYTLTFTTANKAQVASQCDLPIDDPNGTTLTVNVSDATGATYDKSFIFNFNQEYLIRSTATEVNIATGEEHDNGTGVSRTMVLWNKTTNVMRVQYVSDPGTGFTPGSSGYYGYRLYYDEINDEAQIFAYEGPDNSYAQSTRYILAGKPGNGDGLSLSFRQGSVNSGDGLLACVNPNTGDLITDGSLCTPSSTQLAGANVDDNGAIEAMIDQFWTDIGNSNWHMVAGTTTLSWTDMSTMLTVRFLDDL